MNPETRAAISRELYLEVFINDASVKLVGNFKQLPDGGLAATADELAQVGIKPLDAARAKDGLIHLDSLPDVSYRIDEADQRLYVVTTDDGRAAKVIDIGAAQKQDRLMPHSGYGAVLNYSLFASSNKLFQKDVDPFQGISGGFDARFFSPVGTIDQSFVASYSDGTLGGLKRLNTTWSYSDAERLLTYRAGDLISGGLSWTRPVYLGGAQIRRNFALRSDLVTLPLPSFSGTAAVPSTLEVYTQNVRSYAGDVGAGPFQVVNLPTFTGAGEARVVLRDALGRETVAKLPFYASDMLLRRGLLDFSAEVGLPRRNFGILSDDYDQRLMGVASVRYGLTDWLTLEGHFEAGGDLINGGGGVAFPLGPYGAVSLAAAKSHGGGRTGALINAAIQLGYGGWSLYGRVQRTFGDYEDIASVTAEPASSSLDGLPIFSPGVPRAIDQVTLSVPMPLDLSSLSLSYTNLESANGENSRIVGLSYSQQILKRSSFYATAFKDFHNRGSFGVFAGVSIPFDGDINASTGVESGPDGTNVIADLSKSERLEDGSVGWRLSTSEGNTPDRQASVSYRASVARLEAGVQQHGDDFRATVEVDGGFAAAGGSVFATNRIDDAFAVVDAGVPGVEVQYQNRPVGKTDRRGRILVSGLNSNEANTVSIDPRNLPVDADVPATKEVVVPADHSGVVVRFGVSNRSEAALVSLVDQGGIPLEAGLNGSLENSRETFVVGYDGAAYIRGLGRHNTVAIERIDGSSCTAQFAFDPAPGKQVQIGNVVCQ